MSQTERDRALYRSLSQGSTQRPLEDGRAQKVPNSIGAGILAGAVVGVAHLALHLHGVSGSGLHIGPLVVDLGVSTLPLLIVGTLWAGGRAAFSAAFLVHAVLRRLHRVSFAEYGAGGAIVGLAIALLLQSLDLDKSNLLVETVLGAAAGALYRLFAGLIPAN